MCSIFKNRKKTAPSPSFRQKNKFVPFFPPHIVNIPPSDLFSAYDEQPANCVDHYLTDPDSPAEAYFKDRIRAEQVSFRQTY